MLINGNNKKKHHRRHAKSMWHCNGRGAREVIDAHHPPPPTPTPLVLLAARHLEQHPLPAASPAGCKALCWQGWLGGGGGGLWHCLEARGAGGSQPLRQALPGVLQLPIAWVGMQAAGWEALCWQGRAATSSRHAGRAGHAALARELPQPAPWQAPQALCPVIALRWCLPCSCCHCAN